MNDVFSPVITPLQIVPTPSRVEFTDGRSGFRRLVMRGAFLELITVGFYRFWLATDMRRHLWSHTSVEGDAPEYIGTAKELLIGFLFALAILVPLYLVYFLIGIEAERLKAFASVPVALFYYLFIQFAVYRARRYRLTRTVWRGVRFSMSGSGLNYAWRVGLWSLLVAITLGFALPWRQAALERFKMRYTAYGSLQGRFEGTGGGLFKRGWWLWLLLLVLAGGLAVLSATVPIVGVPLLFLFFIASPFLYAMYKAIEWRWWIAGLRIGDVRFDSDMGIGNLIGLYWKVIGWSVLLTTLLSLWGGGVSAIAYWQVGDVASGQEAFVRIMQQPVILFAMALGYVAYILAFWAVMRIYLIHDVW